jgi:hypothetical protein
MRDEALYTRHGGCESTSSRFYGCVVNDDEGATDTRDSESVKKCQWIIYTNLPYAGRRLCGVSHNCKDECGCRIASVLNGPEGKEFGMNPSRMMRGLKRTLMLTATGALALATTGCSIVDTLSEWLSALLGTSA